MEDTLIEFSLGPVGSMIGEINNMICMLQYLNEDHIRLEFSTHKVTSHRDMSWEQGPGTNQKPCCGDKITTLSRTSIQTSLSCEEKIHKKHVLSPHLNGSS
jgi:hypothetical protein